MLIINVNFAPPNNLTGEDVVISCTFCFLVVAEDRR